MSPRPNAGAVPDDASAQLRALADRQAIADLVSRLALALDEHRFDDLRDLFTADAVALTPGGRAEGAERLVAQARRNHLPYARVQHVATNVLADVRGDRGDVRANVVATMVPRAEAPGVHFRLGARYRFDAVRAPGGWRFASLEVTPLWSSGERPAPVPEAG